MMASRDEIEFAPLMDDSEDTTTENFRGHLHEKMSWLRNFSTLDDSKRFPVFRRYLWFIGVQIGLIFLYTTTYWVFALKDHGLVYSPAQSHVKYQTQKFAAELVIESDYIGEPGPAVDLAWHELLQNMNIAVPDSDLKKLGLSSIQVPHEAGMYIAGLSVYHELHCLKRLRQYIWLDYYFPNQTAEEARMNHLHTDHCIDVLRQAIMCHADTSLFTLQWSEAEPMPRADFSNKHQCVDWELLNSWTAERAIPNSKMANLQHPLRGPAFPDGKGSRIGGSEDHSPTVHEG